jgi:multicomponent Na+:H+ antiporter subunit D
VSALPALPVAIPLFVAALLIGTATIVHRRLVDAVAILTAASVAVLCLYLVSQAGKGPLIYWFGGWTPRQGVVPGISFVIDPIGASVAALAAVLATAAFVFSWRYFDAVGTLFHVLMLVFLAAMVGFAMTGDLFNLFVFFELMSVSAYALTGYKIEESGPLQGALNFAITNSLGAFLLLWGIALLYGRTGALNLAKIGQSLVQGPVDALVITAFILLAAGFFVKAAIVPFHFWLADAHAVAPTPVCILFSG